jgi:hypothetical protein
MRVALNSCLNEAIKMIVSSLEAIHSLDVKNYELCSNRFPAHFYFITARGPYAIQNLKRLNKITLCTFKYCFENINKYQT